MNETSNAVRSFEVLIIGAGFSGVYQLYKLRELGFNVKIFDAGGDLGGVWHWNCYPGARVDSHVPNYEYSIEKVWRDWCWSERFPGWEELRRYFAHVEEKLDLKRDIEFNTRVTAATFDEDKHVWRVTCDTGETVEAQFVVTCLGFAAKAYTPDLPGLESFGGTAVHTAHWPQEGLDMTGKRVGVIGVGASGVQVIQEASKVAKELTVFQRTPMIALAMQQRKLSEDDQIVPKSELAEIFRLRNASGGGFYDLHADERSACEVSAAEREEIFERAWARGGFHAWTGTFSDIITNADANRFAYDFWRAKVHARVKDPKTAETLAPREPMHPYGAKRPSLEQWYYEAFNQENVTLVDIKTTPIAEIEPTGVRTTDGFYEFDLLVLATGFDASTGGFAQIDLRGTSGRTMDEYWRDGVKTHLGLGVPEFPNLFMLYGPQSPTAFWNGPASAEVQGDWVIDCLTTLRDKGVTRMEATAEAAQAWNEQMQEMGAGTLLPLADSWYMGANIPGKKRQLIYYLGSDSYMEHCNASAADGYAGFKLA
jgi:cyclohexanone monooxygenase